ncbi:sodium-dependent serotonin transporter-like [Paramacrobiotus metropolitanus]|uniref:sodium-dependent serotonin transporter-like n=1 Tax=Paramacrobiotus metropolitanus TaxID=2943436 RepID=UPI0024459907|nr:sodium-dependent serotonin transporter-like [Paramacrobiotus metropolitanus]
MCGGSLTCALSMEEVCTADCIIYRGALDIRKCIRIMSALLAAVNSVFLTLFYASMPTAGAFLIPYIVMLVVGGMPLLYLELAIGQHYRSGCISIWRYICPLLKGVGFGICLILLYMNFYYNTIISLAMYYLMASFQPELPWTHCNHTWNTDSCSPGAYDSAEEYYFRQVLGIHQSSGIDDLGAPRWQLVCGLAVVYVVTYFALWKGPKSLGKAAWITGVVPFIVLLILLIHGLTLEGSYHGLQYFLYPQWDRLLPVEVWSDAAAQVFFSLGPGYGVYMALASYNPLHNNAFRDAVLTSLVNLIFSFVSGLVVFSILGYQAHVSGRDLREVVTDGPGLVFVALPTAVSTMPGAQFWSAIFFLMLITLGLDSTLYGLEAILTAVSDEYPVRLGKHRKLFCFGLCMLCFLCSLPSTTSGGQYVVTLLDFFGPTIACTFLVLVEIAAFCFLYVKSRKLHDISRMMSSKPGLIWMICWTGIGPSFVVATVFLMTLFHYSPLTLGNYEFPAWSIALGWALTFSSILCISGYIVVALLTGNGALRIKLRKLIRPEAFITETRESVALQKKKCQDPETNPVRF